MTDNPHPDFETRLQADLKSIEALIRTVHRLRAPGGCPWDREQTHQSLRPFLLEETYETLEVLDQIDSPQKLNDPHLKSAYIEEWGDVWLQILLNAEIAHETASDVTPGNIAKTLSEKLIRRHPHVFGTTEVKDSAEVLQNWAKIKSEEKKQDWAPTLQSIPKGMPPIPKCMKVISKVTQVGFQWPDLNGPREKLKEELSELDQAIDSQSKAEIENELGDVLFSICNIASFFKIDPEGALRATLRKFESRFNHVEKRLHEKGSSPKQSNLAEMDQYWDEAKRIEKGLKK